MFGEYTDPYDIDNYYDDVGKIFAKVADYKDLTAPEPIVAPTVAPTTPETAPVAPVVSKFEVTPNTIWIDDHPVGAQPKYNILQSGPPEKESYSNRMRCMPETSAAAINSIWIFVSIIFFVMFVYIIQLQSQIRGNNMILCMLMSDMMAKKK